MKVLIVDDEPLVRKSLERLFCSRGYTVISAEDGHQGLKIWQETRFDLVFLDVLMPGLSGPQVLRAIGNQKTGKVILMSAFTGEHNWDTAKSLGADMFISKPFDNILDLVNEVENLVR